MEFRRIEYFLVLAEKLNYAKAASELCISSQALTKQINLLEEELGTKLFHRTTRAVSLTEDGLMCQEKFSVLKAHYDETLSEVEGTIARNQKQIRVSFFPFLPRKQFLNRIVGSLVGEFDDIDFVISSNSQNGLRDDLREGKVDLILTTAHDFEDWTGLNRIIFKVLPAQIFISPNHPWALEGKREITKKDMEASTFVLLDNQEHYEIDSFYRSIKTKDRLPVSDFDTMLIELQKGKAFGVFPMDPFDIASSDFLSFDLPKELQFSFRTVCGFRKSNQNPVAKKVYQFLEKNKEQFLF